MNLRRALCLLPLLAALPLLHCGDDPPAIAGPGPGPEDGGAASDGSAVVEDPDRPLVPATKIDLLFAVDNSASMGDKQALLGTAVSRVLRRLTDGAGGAKPVTDIHVGVISSSLGDLGGGVCPVRPDAPNDARNHKGHLLNKNLQGSVVVGAENGFLAFGPGGLTDIAKVEQAAKDMIVGVGQGGCGFEAQLESMYRFLIQPDPPDSITVTNQKVVFGPIDNVLLAQRKAFLRPDSAVAIVMLTDEDDSIADPMADKGIGWAYNSRDFPGSLVRRGGSPVQGTTAPRGTKICETNAASPDCRSCLDCNRDEACRAKQDENCSKSFDPNNPGEGYAGYHAPTDDDFNVRFHRMKERFGTDPRFPIERYVKALTNFKVPTRETEHDPATGKYTHSPTCTNPLFANALPQSSTEETCNLPASSRSRKLVLFQLIGGLPPELAAGTPNWSRILGANPDAFDYSGIDPHMIPSVAPRPALAAGGPSDAPRGDNGTDPVQGREWDTKKRDLQYACTFVLPQPRSCTNTPDSCDCADDPTKPGTPAGNPPLCAADPTQIRGKAYPTVRELGVVKALGDRGLVGSICSVDTTSGYGPLLDELATKVTTVLAK